MTRTRRSFLNLLADHNPFYLLSAACMLLACVLLSNSTTWSPIGLRQLLMLIVTLNVYEVLLVGLGLYLIVKRGIRRDGVMLLVLEALFLVDVGFLGAETYQASVRAGVYINIILFALAIAKLYIVFRVLGLRIISPGFALVVVQMATLLALPGVLKHMSDARSGILPDLAMYASWWVAGALMVGFAMVRRSTVLTRTNGDPIATPMAMVFLVLPLVSLAAHLGTSHWVYMCAFRGPDLAPPLLGLATICVAVRSTKRDLRILALLLIVAAIWVSTAPNPALVFDIGNTRVRPIMLTIAGAYMAFVYCFFLHRAVQMLATGVLAGVLYVVSPPLATIEAQLIRAWRWIVEVINARMPRTQGEWGVVSAIGAFVLLALGAAVSLFKRPGDGDHTASTPPSDPPTPNEPQRVIDTVADVPSVVLPAQG